jgi:hypothetical protein
MRHWITSFLKVDDSYNVMGTDLIRKLDSALHPRAGLPRAQRIAWTLCRTVADR